MVGVMVRVGRRVRGEVGGGWGFKVRVGRWMRGEGLQVVGQGGYNYSGQGVGGGGGVLNKVLMIRNRHTVLYFLYWY